MAKKERLDLLYKRVRLLDRDLNGCWKSLERKKVEVVKLDAVYNRQSKGMHSKTFFCAVVFTFAAKYSLKSKDLLT